MTRVRAGTGIVVTTSLAPERANVSVAVVATMHPRALVANPPSLEELFLRHYGRELAAMNGSES